jgi:hypothetical protein
MSSGPPRFYRSWTCVRSRPATFFRRGRQGLPPNGAPAMSFATMSSAKTTSVSRAATCTNLAGCSKARAGEIVEWYAGAGEYCPDCGEALRPDDIAQVRTVTFDGPAERKTEPVCVEVLGAALGPVPTLESHASGPLSVSPAPRERRPRSWNVPLWTWIIAAAAAFGAFLVYAERRPFAAERNGSDATEVCAVPSAMQLARDLVRGLVAKSGSRTQRFEIQNGSTCDVRFSTDAGMPDAVIARDGIVAIVNPLNPISRISEQQLRAIYSGSIRDWAQLGGPPGKIVAYMPVDSADEARAIASPLFLGATVDASVRRENSSADVTRAVTGADHTSRGSIGLVAFSQSIPAKVVPLAYLPSPSVLSIGTRRYPYTMAIAVETNSGRADSDARRLVNFAMSVDGAQIVAKDGLVSRGDL